MQCPFASPVPKLLIRRADPIRRLEGDQFGGGYEACAAVLEEL